MCRRQTINRWFSQLSQGVHTLGVSVSVFVCACLSVPTHVKSSWEAEGMLPVERCPPSLRLPAVLPPFFFLLGFATFSTCVSFLLFCFTFLGGFCRWGWITFFFFLGQHKPANSLTTLFLSPYPPTDSACQCVAVLIWLPFEASGPV